MVLPPVQKGAVQIRSPELEATLDGLIGVALESESSKFTDLMKIAKIDPTKDFRYASLTDVELDDTDVAGWDFSGTRLNGADLTQVKNIEKAFFSAETEFGETKLPPGITVELLTRGSYPSYLEIE